ncbi:hypothetical protein E2542_SST09482 [Spatholobus suberectus]|nr:hypothetical protein E2542_SST09482 [Spatholobus suberectus]
MRWLEVYGVSLTAWGLGSRRFVDGAKYWAMRRVLRVAVLAVHEIVGCCDSERKCHGFDGGAEFLVYDGRSGVGCGLLFCSWYCVVGYGVSCLLAGTRDKACRDKIRVVRWLQEIVPVKLWCLG